MFSITKQFIITVEFGEPPVVKVTHPNSRLTDSEWNAARAFTQALFPDGDVVIVDDAVMAAGREQSGNLRVN